MCYRFGAIKSAPAPVARETEAAPVQGSLFLDVPGQDADKALRPVIEITDAKIESHVEQEPNALSEEQQELLGRMEEIKVSSHIARELLAKWPVSAIRHQLDCLADRKPRSRAATFVKSVTRDVGYA